jgi:hypothetical protein
MREPHFRASSRFTNRLLPMRAQRMCRMKRDSEHGLRLVEPEVGYSLRAVTAHASNDDDDDDDDSSKVNR